MLNIEGKTFMNIQEAVQWLLDNNCIPFQCTANYLANTEIGLGTIVNPSPAKVRIGSLIFFADSKVSTVTGITENGFICSDEYNNLVDDVAYVTNVAINGSGHLITTMSDGQTIDAGIIKQVTSFSINASQHLIATFNNGTTNDLGAIFSGNITISGNLTVSGGISGNAITGNSIVENMSGYYASLINIPNLTTQVLYAGFVKNGNKLTISAAFNFTRTDTLSGYNLNVLQLTFPASIGEKLLTTSIGGYQFLDCKVINAFDSYSTYKPLVFNIQKNNNQTFLLNLDRTKLDALTLNTRYFARFEATFLLSDSLI